ncbi:MAG: carboxypeptidase-like regulatory domain-containing protein, partial [Bacillota bacterium]|nr:carboxypeptidase-like regulatory domain-containing protein [Bacillota bacterium]
MKIRYYSNFKKQFSLFLLLSVFLSSVFTINAAAESTPSRSSYKLFGYISDLPNASAKIKEGFTVSIIGTTLSSKTDSNGYIEINDMPAGSKVNILISKPGFLSREFKNIDTSSDLY